MHCPKSEKLWIQYTSLLEDDRDNQNIIVLNKALDNCKNCIPIIKQYIKMSTFQDAKNKLIQLFNETKNIKLLFIFCQFIDKN